MLEAETENSHKTEWVQPLEPRVAQFEQGVFLGNSSKFTSLREILRARLLDQWLVVDIRAFVCAKQTVA